MKYLAIVLALTSFAWPLHASEMTEDQKTLYALGVVMGQQVANSFAATPAELEVIKKGLMDAATGAKLEVDMAVSGPKIQMLAEARAAVRAEKAKAEGKLFAEKAAKEPGAIRTASGLVYRSLKKGNGANPQASDVVKVHYRGTLPDGQEFDSSYARNQPAQFPLNGVIACWTEGVAKMKVGGKARLVCPSDIAYGERGTGAIPPGATLAFEVELLDIVKSAK